MYKCEFYFFFIVNIIYFGCRQNKTLEDVILVHPIDFPPFSDFIQTKQL